MAAPIYLDNNSTTPVDPLVAAEMLPLLHDQFGNPASKTHSYGWFAEETVKIARERTAALIDAAAGELIFTSGATESNNLAILGAASGLGEDLKSARFISDPIEHRSVLDPLEHLRSRGTDIQYSPVTADGLIDPLRFADLITPSTRFVSLMLGNNEIGTVFDIESLVSICRTKAPQAIIHCDATQSVGKIPVSVKRLGVDLLSLSAHKIYGPKGVGALWIKPEIESKIKPLLFGGGHERGFRSGTLNVAGTAGLGKACEIAAGVLATEPVRMTALAQRFISALRQAVGEVKVNGSTTRRLAGNLNIQIPGIQSSALLAKLGTKVAVSAGSACTSGDPGGSFVLRALGLSPQTVGESIRIGFGRFNTEAEIDQAVSMLAETMTKLRQ